MCFKKGVLKNHTLDFINLIENYPANIFLRIAYFCYCSDLGTFEVDQKTHMRSGIRLWGSTYNPKKLIPAKIHSYIVIKYFQKSNIILG